MPPAGSEEIVLAFVDAINTRNMGAMENLMSADHLFVDSLGAHVRGRSEMRSAWIAYAVMVPDYHIEVRHLFAHGDMVALFGRATGTLSVDGELHPGNRWEMPAAWRAVVKNGQVSEWQVYADNEPVRELLAAGRKGRAGSP